MDHGWKFSAEVKERRNSLWRVVVVLIGGGLECRVEGGASGDLGPHVRTRVVRGHVAAPGAGVADARCGRAGAASGSAVGAAGAAGRAPDGAPGVADAGGRRRRGAAGAGRVAAPGPRRRGDGVPAERAHSWSPVRAPQAGRGSGLRAEGGALAAGAEAEAGSGAEAWVWDVGTETGDLGVWA